MKSCNIAHKIIETVTRNLSCRIKVDTVEFFHNFRVIRNFKIRYKRIAEPLNFNILTVILTNRNRRINNIRNLHHDFRYLCRKV